MGDLTKLTAEELMDVFRASAFGVNEWAEIRRRLERLEKCEAALRLHLEHFGDPLKCIRAALEEK